MKGTVRRGWFHGVCFAVRRRVFEAIGFPDTDRRLGGREDVEFLVRCLRNDVPVGTVGDALLHHFGSITQKAIKLETGQKDLGDRDYFYARVGMGWLARKRFKAERVRNARAWIAEERAGTATRCTCFARTAAGATRRISDDCQPERSEGFRPLRTGSGRQGTLLCSMSPGPGLNGRPSSSTSAKQGALPSRSHRAARVDGWCDSVRAGWRVADFRK
jgi:hypothetical protein